MTRIQIYLSEQGADGQAASGQSDIKVATLYTSLRRGRLTSVLSYETAYLASAGAYAIDPAIPLASGPWPSPGTLPRALLDAAPDRWGRMLIAKREASAAREDGRVPRQLDDAAFLLGTSDLTRQGALRFALTDGGTFQHPEPTVPKLVELPGLFQAVDQATRDGAEAEAAVKRLLSAGSASLGGARPKAAVRDGGRLLIAKFPHAGDGWDVMAWEAVALDLAGAAGITVATTRLVDVGGRSVLLSERFDRRGARRVGYISALTLTGLDDPDRADYLDVAQALARVSADPSRDLAELWRRIAFSVAIHNTDDHLRNLGLLRSQGGWRLAPAFDLNPDPLAGSARVTGIGGASGPRDSATALLERADSFGLSAAEARASARQVADAVAQWEAVAGRKGLGRAERDRFKVVFETGIDALRDL
ncbi:MAG: HipA domain-containing protein [Propionibacteriaceae bacterium]|jgi:serine/threonine-protein kinase HipA|nr:HipA domain-containing protein [Propionibacteriaceae bacterium]